MRLWRILAAVAVGLLAASAQAADPAFDPRSFRGDVGGPLTQVLVLGTSHLSELPESFDPAWLGPVIDRLARYRPDIITIEGLSGQSCDMLIRYQPLYPGVADQYCADTAAAQKATGLTVPAATAAVEATLASWPAQPEPAARRHLASLFLAANDRASALVQWLRLAPAERRAGDGLDAALVTALEALRVRRNENYLVAAVLAARLGLERVYPVDDHSADAITAPLGAAFDRAMEAMWQAPNAFIAAYRPRVAAVKDPASMLALYRFLNLPESQRASARGDFGTAVRQAPPLYGRQYVAWWETRNLRMAANIRAAFGNRPGARVLTIVGASHKAYFDAYLALMHDVVLVDAGEVLR